MIFFPKEIAKHIWFLSDIENQEKLWFSCVEGVTSSFSEVICGLYDDYQFKEYVDALSADIKKNDTDLIKALAELDFETEKFLGWLEDRPFSKDMLEVEGWRRVCLAAKKVCQLSEGNLPTMDV